MLLAQSKNFIQATYSTIQLLKDITRPSELPASFKKRSLSDSELRRRRSEPGTVLSRKEVALHNTEDDCWLIVKNKVSQCIWTRRKLPRLSSVYSNAPEKTTRSRLSRGCCLATCCPCFV